MRGHILIETDGMEIGLVPLERRNQAVLDFFSMKGTAESAGDTFYAKKDIWEKEFSYGTFYPGFANIEWAEALQRPEFQGVEQATLQLAQDSIMRSPCPKELLDTYTLASLPIPSSLAGFQINPLPNDYLYDAAGWEEWRRRWLVAHQEDIDWGDDSNQYFPRLDRTRQVLLDCLGKWKAAPPNDGIEKLFKDVRLEGMKTVEDVANQFHEIMKHLDERERIDCTKTVGSQVCEANYYKREEELEKMEQSSGNQNVSVIYSMRKGGEYRFLSLDTQHGMFEVCDDRGDHVGEIRFDGTHNSDAELDHSLLRVADRKKLPN